jgi:hypothetical protein
MNVKPDSLERKSEVVHGGAGMRLTISREAAKQVVCHVWHQALRATKDLLSLPGEGKE